MDEQAIIPQSTRKNHKGLKTTLIVLLVVLLVASLGYNFYLWNQYNTTTSQLSSTQESNNKLNDQNAKLTSERDAAQNEIQPPVSVMPVLTDKEAAQKEAQLYLDAQALGSGYMATIKTLEGNFASAGFASSTTPNQITSGAYLKKVRSEWVVVWTGQNGPDKATGERLGLPVGWYNSTN